MNRRDNWLYLLLGGFLLFLFGRQSGKIAEKGNAPPIAPKPTCEGFWTDAQAAAYAATLRSIFDEWYIDASDETRVIDVFRQIQDECSARKLFHAFGHFSTTLYGQGDLDFWMSTRISEPAKVSCRAKSFGVSTF